MALLSDEEFSLFTRFVEAVEGIRDALRNRNQLADELNRTFVRGNELQAQSIAQSDEWRRRFIGGEGAEPAPAPATKAAAKKSSKKANRRRG